MTPQWRWHHPGLSAAAHYEILHILQSSLKPPVPAPCSASTFSASNSPHSKSSVQEGPLPSVLCPAMVLHQAACQGNTEPAVPPSTAFLAGLECPRSSCTNGHDQGTGAFSGTPSQLCPQGRLVRCAVALFLILCWLREGFLP